VLAEQIFDPKNGKLYEAEKHTEDTFSFIATDDGMLFVCMRPSQCSRDLKSARPVLRALCYIGCCFLKIAESAHEGVETRVCAGIYRLCFLNFMSTYTSKIVTFQLHVGTALKSAEMAKAKGA
jgi:hypothetical protein